MKKNGSASQRVLDSRRRPRPPWRPQPPRPGDKAELADRADWIVARVVSVDGGRILFQPFDGKPVAHGMDGEGKTWRRGWAIDRRRR